MSGGVYHKSGLLFSKKITFNSSKCSTVYDFSFKFWAYLLHLAMPKKESVYGNFLFCSEATRKKQCQ